MVDALHSKCSIERCVGSSPTSGTIRPRSPVSQGIGAFVISGNAFPGFNTDRHFDLHGCASSSGRSFNPGSRTAVIEGSCSIPGSGARYDDRNRHRRIRGIAGLDAAAFSHGVPVAGLRRGPYSFYRHTARPVRGAASPLSGQGHPQEACGERAIRYFRSRAWAR